MNKQIAVGVIVMIALTAIGTTSQAVQSQSGDRGNDPVGGISFSLSYNGESVMTRLGGISSSSPV